MALYQIVETPGRKVVAPLEGDPPISNQDAAKVIVARLRAEARRDDRKVDFVVQPLKTRTSGPANGAGGTSIRLTEEVRSRLARFCGRIMMETGDAVSMGDAVNWLMDYFDKTSAFFDFEAQQFDEDKMVAEAKRIIKERKAAANGD